MTAHFTAETPRAPATPAEARAILADPARVRGNPGLATLARQVARSELGPNVTLLRLHGRPTRAPHLAVIDGGRA